jgi:D-alanyl-D-alanine carboxypeptidase
MGFEGVKTGITDAAGPCLAASYIDKRTNNLSE